MNLNQLLSRYAYGPVAQRLAAALSAVAIALVLILVGMLLMSLLFFALAYWVGVQLGQTWMGFAILTGAALLVLLIVFCNRQRWVGRPIAGLVTKAFRLNEEDTAAIASPVAPVAQQGLSPQAQTVMTVATTVATAVATVVGAYIGAKRHR